MSAERRELDVDTSYPIIMCQQGFIMDGWHRVGSAKYARKLRTGTILRPIPSTSRGTLTVNLAR